MTIAPFASSQTFQNAFLRVWSSLALKRAQKLPDAIKCQQMPVRAWKARKTLTVALRRSGAPIPLTRGFQVARNRASPPAKPICTEQTATRLVGGRRPSVLQRGGAGGLPRRFPVALKALPEPWRLGGFEARFRRSLARKPSPWLVFAGNAP